ncbi:retron system putative HNH endonuclease [uncultured Thiodictyon sp.]|uniref:retron system putative HNH endonuclease n=1 Tax=uncultured Thiodictyon sp. TaxID=1846217 RepID=UPI0025E64A63|nr:retron system putative HNH endonuclease [uncultured Thiodictyon sp.]
MRAIRKRGQGTHDLQVADARPPTTPHDAKTRWSSFGHKAELQKCLLSEQYMLCAYSEIRADQQGFGYHIEHVKPKSQFPADTFLYSNLVASALSSDDLKSLLDKEVFGGHAKHNEYDSQRFVSCLDPECSRFFAYLSDGRVEPANGLSVDDYDRALYTRDLLNLNSPFLVNRRRRWWDELDALLQQHLDEDQSLYHLAAVDLLPINGQLSQFFTTTRQFFGPVAEQVLQDGAPELL